MPSYSSQSSGALQPLDDTESELCLSEALVDITKAVLPCVVGVHLEDGIYELEDETEQHHGNSVGTGD